jgi:hypothetical protein
MSHEPPPTADPRPGGSQFSLRGMFVLMTAMSIIFAVLALVLKTPRHWLGALALPFICVSIIATIEFFRALFPPQPRFPPHLSPPPSNPLQTGYFRGGENPFGPGGKQFPTESKESGSPFAK